jgi:hypothetical protein
MSATAFFMEVNRCRRLLRHHRQVKDEMRQSSPARRFARRILPWAIVPIVSLPLMDAEWFPLWVGITLQVLVLLGPLTIDPLLRLTTFEALHMPSRRALYVARLLRWLPWWLWGGFCGTTALLIAHRGALQDMGQAALYLLIGAQVPWLLLAAIGAAMMLIRWWGNLAFVVFFVVYLPLVWFFGGAGAWLPLLPPTMLLLSVGLLAFQVWGLGRLEPMEQIHHMPGAMRAPQLVKPVKPKATTLRHGRVPAKLGPAPLLAQRQGLGWAALYYAFNRLRPRGFGDLWFLLFVPGILFLSVLWLVHGSGDWVWWGLLVSNLVGLNGSELVVSDPQRLYLLGVDYRRQLEYRLRVFWVTPALLIVSAGALLAIALWGEVEMPLALVALVLGLKMQHEGWLGWPLVWTTSKALSGLCLFLWVGLFLWLGLLVMADRRAWLPAPGWDTAMRVQLFAAACGVTGVVGMVYKWWRCDEACLAKVTNDQSQPVCPAPQASDVLGSHTPAAPP